MRLTPLALAAGLALAGCAQMPRLTDRPAAPQATATAAQASAATAVTRAPSPAPVARATPAQLDTTTPEQRAAAAQTPASAGGETRLGTTVASLGNPSEGGFWIKTPLVDAPAEGRIVNPATGKSAQVELRPLSGGGSGSQVSLPALQLLGVSLTDLPTLEVYRS